ncbi:MAG: DUF5674 family protein [bacterium]
MSDIRIIKDKISLAELEPIAQERFGDMVKAVVDCQRQIMAIGAGLHADAEAVLLQDGSQQNDLWGINLYPQKKEEEWLEFNSMINIRPSRNNRSRGVEDPAIREKIIAVVKSLVIR